ncbi:hypothetical protein [Denitrobaculum tricleocarpae]|uniref:hypothetical protein n=1 Tax=Denitrobaculum tricleocarpae TaxID=2591009 RepID=UPI001FE60DEE|nr:hypothetical protein [Denitrobaculum tricleocarpae]
MIVPKLFGHALHRQVRSRHYLHGADLAQLLYQIYRAAAECLAGNARQKSDQALNWSVHLGHFRILAISEPEPGRMQMCAPFVAGQALSA